MSTSTDGILAYGITVDVELIGDILEENDETEDAVEAFENKLLALNGFTEKQPTEDLSPNFWKETYRPWRERREAALKALGISLVTHCGSEDEMYILAAWDTHASRGCPVDVDLSELNLQRMREGWDNRIADAMKQLGWTSDQKPRWILASWWA